MATLIDETNFSTLLVESSQGRSGTPDGNFFFDSDNDRIQLIGDDELENIIITDTAHPAYTDGVTPVANELNNFSGITLRGLYNFENERRRNNETLRTYLRGSQGTYRFAGAFDFINGVKLDDTALADGTTDRNKIRGSGFIEYAATQDGKTDVDRIYHGNNSLVDIQPTTQPRYAFVTDTLEATLQAATWNNYSRLGDINEVVQVYGSTAFGDASAGNFDYTQSILVVRVRSWQYNPGETTSVATNISEFSGFLAGYGVGEVINPSNIYNLFDVYPQGDTTAAQTISVNGSAGTFTIVGVDFAAVGFEVGQSFAASSFTNGGNNVTKVISSITTTSTTNDTITVTDNTGLVTEAGGGDEQIVGVAIAPFDGMTMEKLGAAQSETGFNEADGNFTWVLHNTGGGSAQECAAYLDALTLKDLDIDVGAGSYNGQKGRVWYSRNASGKIVTASIESEGLFIEGLSIAEQQNVIFNDDAATSKTYPFFPSVEITPGAAAIADTNAWYHVYYTDGAGAQDFDFSGAVTVNDKDGNPVKGNVSTDQVGNKISFAYAYDTNTQAGLSAAVDKPIVVIVEGDGGAAQAITYATITRDTVVPITCTPSADNNA
jgi:hypothetical protein